MCLYCGKVDSLPKNIITRVDGIPAKIQQYEYDLPAVRHYSFDWLCGYAWIGVEEYLPNCINEYSTFPFLIFISDPCLVIKESGIPAKAIYVSATSVQEQNDGSRVQRKGWVEIPSRSHNWKFVERIFHNETIAVTRWHYFSGKPVYKSGEYGYFVIAHLLKELGFRKESPFYFVKAKREEPKLFKIRYGNFWDLKHYDFNRFAMYEPSFGERWKNCNRMNIPIFQEYKTPGYLCTCPSAWQIYDFCSQKGIRLVNTSSCLDIIIELVTAYRKKTGFENAFQKILKRLNCKETDAV